MDAKGRGELVLYHRAVRVSDGNSICVLQLKGELSSERKEACEKAQKSYEKLLANTTSLAVCPFSILSMQIFL